MTAGVEEVPPTKSEAEFDALGPLPAPGGESLWEYKDTLVFPINNVWTILEGDETDNWYASPGYHVVNKVGYMVTAVPWTDEIQDYIYFEDDGDDDGEWDEEEGEP